MNDSTFDMSSSNHGPNWFIRHPLIAVGLSLLLLLLFAVALADLFAGRGIDRQLREIRNKGEPVTVQDLLAAEHPPSPADNVTAGLLAAVQPFVSIKPPEERLESIPVLGGVNSLPTGQRLPTEQIEAGTWYLDQHPQALAAMQEACKRPAGWFNFHWSTPMLFIQLPDLSTLRHASKVLALDARLSAERDNPKEAGNKLLTCYQCASCMDSNRYCVLIGSLVRIAFGSLAMDTTERIINRVRLNDVDLKNIQLDLMPWCQLRGWADSIVVERASHIDILTSVRAGSLSNRGMLLVPVVRYSDEREGIALLTELITALRIPEPNTMDAIRKWRKRPSASASPFLIMTNSMQPSIEHATNLAIRSTAEARALQAAIACERFQIAQSRWPTALVELVPNYLMNVPIDPFDGNPIRYSVIPTGIKVWSIGEDEKDDGGDVRRLEPYDRKSVRKDVGWVIVNPDQRGRS